MAATLNKAASAELARKAWELRVKGWRETRIAEELGVHKSTICRALQRVEKQLHKQFTATAEQIKSRQTAQLEYIQEEAMEAWERSKEDAEKRKVKRQGVNTDESVKIPAPGSAVRNDYDAEDVPGLYIDESGEEVSPEERARRIAESAIARAAAAAEAPIMPIVETVDETKQQCGDARYLAEARNAMKDVRDIWGLNAQKDQAAQETVVKVYVGVDTDGV